MRDESEDLRHVGRDEMNLCEFPITTLADRVSPGCKTMVFEDRHGKLTVIGSDAYGLPTALDSDVIVALIQLTKQRNDFTDPTVEFSRYELLKLLGWENRGWNYRRLSESLHRWVDCVAEVRRMLVEQQAQAASQRQLSHPRIRGPARRR